MKKIYMPKLFTKFVAPFMYNNTKSYSNINNTNEVFSNRSNQGFMLGIQTGFGYLGASIVSSSGEVLADERKSLFTHRNTQGFVNKQLIQEFLNENLSRTVEDAFKAAGLTYDQLKGIAVSIGPAETAVVNNGIHFAQKAGRENNVPVYAVNNHEAHIFSNRMNMDASQRTNTNKLPFFTVPFLFY